MNQLTITGRLTKDATINNAGTTKVINFTVATDVGYGDKKHALFVDCSKFGDNINVSNYLQKGQQVLIIGEADLREWTSQDGKHGANVLCRVDKIELLGSKQDGAQISGAGQSASNKQQAEPTQEEIDSLPF